jgi:hypothetical protein
MTTLSDIRLEAINEAGAGGLTVYATLDDLPTSGLTSGDQAFITATNRIYVSNGSGWYNIALFNATPTLTIDPSGAVTLETDGSTPTVITLTGTDSDNADVSLTYTVESDGSFANIATLSQDSSVFTITPLAEGSATPGSSTLTFKVSDGISFGTGTTEFSLTFGLVFSSKNIETYGSVAAGDNFAYALTSTSDKDTFVVGAPTDSYGDTADGTAHIFRRNGNIYLYNQLIQPYISPNINWRTPNSRFGHAMDISDDGAYIIVTAPWYAVSPDVQRGHAFIFFRNGSDWTNSYAQARLQNTSLSNSDRFGWAASINNDGSWAVVGSQYPNTNSGRIWFYSRAGTTWTETQVINGSANSRYGSAVEFNSSVGSNGYPKVAVGSSNFNSGQGRVQILQYASSSWGQASIVPTPVGGGTTQGFGAGLKFTTDGTRFIAGASGITDGLGGTPGGAFVYVADDATQTSYTQEAMLTFPVAYGIAAGGDVHINDDGTLATVAPYSASGPSSAVIFKREGSTWTELARVQPDHGVSGTFFGGGAENNTVTQVFGTAGSVSELLIPERDAYLESGNGGRVWHYTV